MIKKLLVPLAFILSAYTAYSCDCASDAPFLSSTGGSRIIALVKIKKHMNFQPLYRSSAPMAMEAEIVEVLRGEEKRKTITIWGDNGGLCRPYILQFRENTSWVVALDGGDERAGQKGEKSDDYFISNCGTHWLEAGNSSISGVIEGSNSADRPGTMSLSALRTKLKKKS